MSHSTFVSLNTGSVGIVILYVYKYKGKMFTSAYKEIVS